MIMMRIPKLIDHVDFGMTSPDEIRKISVTKIVTADTYDEDGYPIERGLMDSRLGVVDPGLRCRTCGARAGDCPGHFGHVELARPVPCGLHRHHLQLHSRDLQKMWQGAVTGVKT